MQKHEELLEIKNKYAENFKKLAKEFYDETGLIIDDITFAHPLKRQDNRDELIPNSTVRIGVQI